MGFFQVFILSVIQGVAELLPISSSAHVIIAQKLMGLDPGTPAMTFLLVMLHTGTMFAAIVYFWSRWRRTLKERKYFVHALFIATFVTGVLGLFLKWLIEKPILEGAMGYPKGEVEHLFRNIPMISVSLLSVGSLILFSSRFDKKGNNRDLGLVSAVLIGIIQGLCLPLRGFSRSGATISTAMMCGVSRELAEEFSFALAVLLTPPVLFLQIRRMIQFQAEMSQSVLSAYSLNLLGYQVSGVFSLYLPGFIGVIFSFLAGLIALKFLSRWLEKGRWKYFGVYCISFSIFIFGLHWFIFKNP